MARPVAKSVSITVGGATYRVMATAPESELRRLASLVDARLRELDPTWDPATQPVTLQTFILASLALAHDADELRQERERTRLELEDERARRLEAEATTRDFLRRMINRIEDVLDEEKAPSEPAKGANERARLSRRLACCARGRGASTTPPRRPGPHARWGALALLE
jgi:cell division protein ZapA (FtsZ GTPase activity inhibitor)